MISRDELDAVLEAGGRLLASDGTDLGPMDQLVLDSSGTPAFASVRAGFFGISQRFVPLDGATLEGSTIRVAFDGGRVRSAPGVTSDRGGLGESDARALREHYGLPAEVTPSGAEVTPSDVGPPVGPRPPAPEPVPPPGPARAVPPHPLPPRPRPPHPAPPDGGPPPPPPGPLG